MSFKAAAAARALARAKGSAAEQAPVAPSSRWGAPAGAQSAPAPQPYMPAAAPYHSTPAVNSQFARPPSFAPSLVRPGAPRPVVGGAFGGPTQPGARPPFSFHSQPGIQPSLMQPNYGRPPFHFGAPGPRGMTFAPRPQQGFGQFGNPMGMMPARPGFRPGPQYVPRPYGRPMQGFLNGRPGLPPGVSRPGGISGTRPLSAQPMQFVAAGQQQPRPAPASGSGTAATVSIPPQVANRGASGQSAASSSAMGTGSTGLTGSGPVLPSGTSSSVSVPSSQAYAAQATSGPFDIVPSLHLSAEGMQTARLSIWVGKLPPTDVVPAEAVEAAIRRACRPGRFGLINWERAGYNAQQSRGARGPPAGPADRAPMKGFGFATVEGALAAARLCSLDGLKLWEAHESSADAAPGGAAAGQSWEGGISVKLGKEAETVLAAWAVLRQQEAREARQRARVEAKEKIEREKERYEAGVSADSGSAAASVAVDPAPPTSSSSTTAEDQEENRAGAGAAAAASESISTLPGHQLPAEAGTGAEVAAQTGGEHQEYPEGEDQGEPHFSQFVDGAGARSAARYAAKAAIQDVLEREGKPSSITGRSPAMSAGLVSEFRKMAEQEERYNQERRQRLSQAMRVRAEQRAAAEKREEATAERRRSVSADRRSSERPSVGRHSQGRGASRDGRPPAALAPVDSRFVDDDSDSEDSDSNKKKPATAEQSGASTSGAGVSASIASSHAVEPAGATHVDASSATASAVAGAKRPREEESGSSVAVTGGEVATDVVAKKARTESGSVSVVECATLPPLDDLSVQRRVQSKLGPFIAQLFAEDGGDTPAGETGVDQYSEDVREFLGFVVSIAVKSAVSLREAEESSAAALEKAKDGCTGMIVREFGEVIGEEEAQEVAGLVWSALMGQ